MALLLQQMQASQNMDPNELQALLLRRQKMQEKQQMSTQLQVFAKQMFKRLNQRQKKKLESKAKQYLDQVFKDRQRIAKSKPQPSNA